MGLVLAVLVIARDVVIFTGAVAYYFLLRPFEGQPTLLSKVNTLFQILVVFAVLVSQTVLALSEGLLDTLIVVTALTTVSSGVLYVYTWGSSYLHESRHPGA